MIGNSGKGINFYQAVKREAELRGSLYTGKCADVRSLADFLEMNGWFGVDIPADGGLEVLRGEPAEELASHLYLWLEAYGKSDAEKLGILARHGKEILPETTSAYISYIRESELENDANSWKLLDYLIAKLRKELSRMGDGEVQMLFAGMNRELPLVTAKLFSGFYEETKRRDGKNHWVYRCHTRSRMEGNEAYPVKGFSRMAYCIFNAEYWERQGLLEKACVSGGGANLWAFLAMHFVCGMRAADIVRIPKPELPCDGAAFRERLLAGHIADAGVFAEDIQIRMEYKSCRPQKTDSYSNIPLLKLFIPASLEEPLGVILSLAASYHEEKRPGEPFLKQERDIAAIRKFFGEPFADVLHGKNFSSRRANKSYLQGIEMAAGMDGKDAPKGYMLAALARSHKGGIGTLPDVTEIYLKDAAFTGYTPEFIAREMFERGVFGFIPHLLLETYAGEDYKKLDVGRQTDLIRAVGISPSGIEELAGMAQKNLKTARETVSSLAADRAGMAFALQRIASGNAPGKDQGSLCMMAACGYACARTESRGCTGCRYEVYTKAVMHQMMKEYARMKQLCGADDGWRYKEMIKHTILPMMGEFLHSIRELYPGADMGAVAEIMEGGMGGYGGCGKPVFGGRI